jgi:hypothetical protein
MKSVHTKFTQKRARENRSKAKPLRALWALRWTEGVNLVEKNLRILSILNPLEKSSGNLQVLKRRTRGANGALGGERKIEVRRQRAEVREQESGGGGRNEKCKLQNANWEGRGGAGIGASARIGGGVGRRGGVARFLGEFGCFPDRHQTAKWRCGERASFAMTHMDGTANRSTPKRGLLTTVKLSPFRYATHQTLTSSATFRSSCWLPLEN